MVKWSGYVQQGTGVGTGVQLLTVEQECLLLEADVKHSEVQNLFSLLNDNGRKDNSQNNRRKDTEAENSAKKVLKSFKK